jgi:lysophospholipase L1-like esterase
MKIAVFGDSITYGVSDEKGGWTNRLRMEVEKDDIAASRRVANCVYNCGIRGDTTEDLLTRFDVECSSRVERQDDPIIIFAIGTNDSSTKADGNNAVPQAQYKDNLTKLLNKAQTVSDKILFVGLFPVDDQKTLNWKPDRSYSNKSVQEYNTIVSAFCKEHKLAFVDLFKPFYGKSYEDLLSDGLHPTSKGHQKIYKLVSKALRKNNLLVQPKGGDRD